MSEPAVLELGEGFRDDDVAVLLDGREVWSGTGITTNYSVGLAAVVPLPEPVAVQPGDVIRVTCTHDATLRQRLPQLREQPPRYVVWGEGTADEMCLGLIVWSAQQG